MRLTRVVPDRLIEFVPDSAVIRFLLNHITFAIELVDGGCRVTQQIKLRIGPLGRALNRRAFAAVEQHMREEATT